MENTDQYPRRKIDKPLGVYIIAIFNIIAMGIIQLASFILLMRISQEEIPLFLRLLNVGLPVIIIAASVWAAAGDNAGRRLLLTAVTMLSLGIILNSLILLVSGDAAGENVIKAVGYIIRAGFWLGINWWYFMRPSTLAYYRQKK